MKHSDKLIAIIYGIQYPISEDGNFVYYDNTWYEGRDEDGYFRITHKDGSIVDFEIIDITPLIN